jgi:hypothetical protein
MLFTIQGLKFFQLFAKTPQKYKNLKTHNYGQKVHSVCNCPKAGQIWVFVLSVDSDAQAPKHITDHWPVSLH